MTLHELTYRRAVRGEPTLGHRAAFPWQGEWTVEEYLALNTNRHVEFADGVLEFLPMPTEFHEFLLQFLYRPLCAFVEPKRLGTPMFAGISGQGCRQEIPPARHWLHVQGKRAPSPQQILGRRRPGDGAPGPEFANTGSSIHEPARSSCSGCTEIAASSTADSPWGVAPLPRFSKASL
jgi:hypothetical protein